MKKKIICLILSIFLIIINFSGCISYPIVKPSGPTKHPKQPLISIDDKGNAYLFWEIYNDGKYIVKLVEIDSDGKKINEKKILHISYSPSPKILIDKEENFHLFFTSSNESLEYLKINNNGEVLINKILAPEVYNGEYGSFDTSKLFDIAIDTFDNLHIMYLIKNFDTSYIKIDHNGNILNSKNLGKFIQNITFYLDMVDFSFYLTIDYNNIIWTIWPDGGNKYNTINNLIEGFNKSLNGNAIKVDKTGNIHILSGSNYKKINNNNDLVTTENFNNISVIDNYPVVKDDNENYLFLGDNGFVDKDNNVHIVELHEESKEWESGRYYEDYYYNTIYYKKFDKNGTVLIDNMVIDTDGDPSWETGSYQLTSFIILLIFILPVAILIIILLYLSFRKKKNNNIWRK